MAVRDLKAGREKGQSLAELALLLPLLIVILLGCLDLGRAFSVWITMANGSREGARYASLWPEPEQDVRDFAKRDIAAQGLSTSDETLTIDVGYPAGVEGGSPVIVTAGYTLPMMTSFLFGGTPLQIRASTQMVIQTGGG